MANIRVAYALSSILLATPAAATVSAGVSTYSTTVSAQPNQVIAVSAFVVPMEYLEEQTVTMSDFRTLSIDKVLIDVVTITDTNNVSFDITATAVDSVAIVENSVKIFSGTVDFDLSDPDVDPDPINIADSDAKDVGKTFTDTATATDSPAKTPGKVVTDSVTSADVITTIDVGKSLTDTATTNDTINTFNTDKVVADSATATDAAAKDFTRPDVTDSVTTADDSSRQPELGKTETVTASDAFGPFDIGVNPNDTATATDAVNTFVVDKVLTDSVEMTDFIAKTPGYEFDFDVVDADADPDPVTMADVMAKEFTRPITDTVTMADAINTFAIENIQTDAVTMADAINLVLTLGQSTPLYDFAFMSDDKFTYFAVPGTINSHLIHEPVVNGEFVLTTDPNAGIVYTIRTESYSYMFAGYGLNENQLN